MSKVEKSDMKCFRVTVEFYSAEEPYSFDSVAEVPQKIAGDIFRDGVIVPSQEEHGKWEVRNPHSVKKLHIHEVSDEENA